MTLSDDFNSTFVDRFWAKVNKTESCWLWTASVLGMGYGQITKNGRGEMIKAHRASYIMAYGAVPKGKLVCHSCDMPGCVNPQHLFLGSCADNHADRNKKGRQAKGENSGQAKLTEEKVLEIRALVDSYTQEELAKMYNTCKATIWNVVMRKTWKHIE